MRDAFVLDACALIAVLKREDSADNVVAAYEKANSGKASLLMNKVNLFEVF